MTRTRHAFEPSAERLEAHVLLSIANPAPAVAAMPISEMLTTDKSTYKVGEPIRITLTETNNTDATVTMPNIGHGSGFTASRDLKTVWVSRQRRQSTAALTLEPGQTRSVTVVWNGRPDVAAASHSTPVTGKFRIDNTLANSTVTIVIDPAHGKGSTTGPTSSLPNQTLTLTG